MSQSQDPGHDEVRDAEGVGPADEPVTGTDPDVAGAGSDPNADLKARYRDALAHKHGSSGAHKETHGDAGSAAHSQSTGPTQKMFRRKAGG